MLKILEWDKVTVYALDNNELEVRINNEVSGIIPTEKVNLFLAEVDRFNRREITIIKIGDYYKPEPSDH